MDIFVIRKKLLENDLPTGRGAFTFNINIPLNNGMKEHYDHYISIRTNKTNYARDYIFPNLDENNFKRAFNRFKANKTIYQKFVQMRVNDFLYYTGKSTANIIVKQQIFIPTQITSIPSVDVENNSISINVNVLSTPKKKQYGNPKEVSAFMAPGTLYKVKEEYYDTLLYRGIGTIKRNHNLYIPIEISMKNNESDIISVNDINLLIKDINNHLAALGINPNDVPFEIEIHSPGRLVLTVAEASINIITSIPEVSNRLNDDFLSALNASSAIDPEVAVAIERLREADIFSNQNIMATTTIYNL